MKRCKRMHAQVKQGTSPGVGHAQSGDIICTGRSTQKKNCDVQSTSTVMHNTAALKAGTNSKSPVMAHPDHAGLAASRNRGRSADSQSHTCGHTQGGRDRASSASRVPHPSTHTADALGGPLNPTRAPPRPHSCPAKHSYMQHHDATDTQSPTVSETEPANEVHVDSTQVESCGVPFHTRRGHSHEPPRLPPPRLRTRGTDRTLARDLSESGMVLGGAAPCAVRRPNHKQSRLRGLHKDPGVSDAGDANSVSSSPEYSADGSPWIGCSPPHTACLQAEPSPIRYPAVNDKIPNSGNPEEAATVDLNPRKSIPEFLKAGSGHAAWNADRSSRSRARVAAQRASNKRQRARAAAATSSRSPRGSSRRASGSKRRRSSHAGKARLHGVHASYLCLVRHAYMHHLDSPVVLFPGAGGQFCVE